MAVSTVSEPIKWTPEYVKAEMITAFEVLFYTTGGVGPRDHTSNWPEYLRQVTASDSAEQRLSGTNSVGRMKARIQRSARDISNMEKVLLGHRGKDGKEHPAWVVGYLNGSDGMRRCLVASCIWKSRGLLAKKECRKRGWSYTTFRRSRDRAAEIIAFRLNEAGISLFG